MLAKVLLSFCMATGWLNATEQPQRGCQCLATREESETRLTAFCCMHATAFESVSKLACLMQESLEMWNATQMTNFNAGIQ